MKPFSGSGPSTSLSSTSSSVCCSGQAVQLGSGFPDAWVSVRLEALSEQQATNFPQVAEPAAWVLREQMDWLP